MIVTIELPDQQIAALKKIATARGVSSEQYARRVLEEDLNGQFNTNPTTSSPVQQTGRPISEVIAEIMADTPPEELAKLPADGASHHDHYLYGWPRNQR